MTTCLSKAGNNINIVKFFIGNYVAHAHKTESVKNNFGCRIIRNFQCFKVRISKKK